MPWLCELGLGFEVVGRQESKKAGSQEGGKPGQRENTKVVSVGPLSDLCGTSAGPLRISAFASYSLIWDLRGSAGPRHLQVIL